MEPLARLLVVDDDESNRDMLSRRLRKAGYEVESAEDGRRALDLLEKHVFDLMLLDNMMPGLSGVEVLRRVREKHSPCQLPVIMVTAQCDGASVLAALRQGANDYLTKPMDFPAALARIEIQLKRRWADRIVGREVKQATTGGAGSQSSVRWARARIGEEDPGGMEDAGEQGDLNGTPSPNSRRG